MSLRAGTRSLTGPGTQRQAGRQVACWQPWAATTIGALQALPCDFRRLHLLGEGERLGPQAAAAPLRRRRACKCGMHEATQNNIHVRSNAAISANSTHQAIAKQDSLCGHDVGCGHTEQQCNAQGWRPGARQGPAARVGRAGPKRKLPPQKGVGNRQTGLISLSSSWLHWQLALFRLFKSCGTLHSLHLPENKMPHGGSVLRSSTSQFFNPTQHPCVVSTDELGP
jgi:hypothetical protein